MINLLVAVRLFGKAQKRPSQVRKFQLVGADPVQRIWSIELRGYLDSATGLEYCT